MSKFYVVCALAVLLNACTSTEIHTHRDAFEGTVMFTEALPVKVALGFNKRETEVEVLFERVKAGTASESYNIILVNSTAYQIVMGGAESLLMKTDTGTTMKFSSSDKSSSGLIQVKGWPQPKFAETVTYKNVPMEKVRSIAASQYVFVRVVGSNRRVDGYLADDSIVAVQNLINQVPKVLAD